MSRTIQHENRPLARSSRCRGDIADSEHSTLVITVLFAGVLIAALLAGGCRESLEQEPELEAIDVLPAVVIGTEDDPKEVVRPPALVGVLPEDFPDGLPLYLPASLIDFGTVDDGWVYVNLLTPHSLGRVERELSTRLTERGWTMAGNGATAPLRGDGDVHRLRRGNSRVRLVVEDARPGTQYRFEYPG